MIGKTSALHFAPFWLLVALVSGLLTGDQKTQMLDLHNRYRSMVSPNAANMQLMTWNDALSLVAEDYAAQCIWEHNPDVMDQLGENLFLTTGRLKVDKAVANWFDENINYDYDANTCRAGMCGHYTQLVWAKSTAVGCGAFFCRTVKNETYKNATILVCNYDPAGNVEGQHPYEEGKSCSKCPQGMNDCINNICVETHKTTEEPFVTWTTHSWTTESWATETETTEVDSSGFRNPAGVSLLLAAVIPSFLLE